MSPNSSSPPKGQPPHTETSATLPSEPPMRRVWLAILLPLWVVVGFVLSQILIFGASTLLPYFGIAVEGINMAVLNATLAALAYLLSLIVVIGIPMILGISRTTLSNLGLDRLPAWKDLVLALAGFVAYLLSAAVLITLVTKFVPGFDAEETQEIGFEDLTQRYEYVLAFITLVVIAPIAEEILMRGYLYGKLRRIMSVVSAMIVTAALFAVLHLQWNVAVDVFALSLVLTILREKTGSIWASILVHMMKNGLAFYLLFINTTLSHTMGG